MNGLHTFMADPPVILTGGGLSVLILLFLRRIRRIRLVVDLDN